MIRAWWVIVAGGAVLYLPLIAAILSLAHVSFGTLLIIIAASFRPGDPP